MKKVNSVRRIVFTILAVTWMVVIFSFSARPGDESEEQSIKAGMMVCHVFVPGFDDLSENHDFTFQFCIIHLMIIWYFKYRIILCNILIQTIHI